MKRRTFLKSAALAAGSPMLSTSRAFSQTGNAKRTHFTVHPFIERHPEAVFIMRTNVDKKTNREANRRTGTTFARSVFIPSDRNGIPVSRKIAIKPNITGGGGNSLETMGIITDPFFVEGVVDGMKPLGLGADQFAVREVNSKSWDGHVYMEMANHAGIDFRAMNGRIQRVEKSKMPTWCQTDEILPTEDTVWKDVDGGVIYRKIPYLWPLNDPDAVNLNIAKFKTHGMGLTLCCKNFQGSCANGYQNFCGGYDRVDGMPSQDINPRYRDVIEANLKRHADMGVPRWSDSECDINEITVQEVWSARALDNLSASTFGLHIVEGIYGRDGHFSQGPNPHGNENNRRGAAWDYMTNIIIFGKDPVRVDIIGHWLGGHEPGNFGFFHIARERGMSNVLNPADIPVYHWEDDSATQKPLASFERTPLKTVYLPKIKGDNPEQVWHMCDEPFDYSAAGGAKPTVPRQPGIAILTSTALSDTYPLIALEYRLSQKNPVRLEVIDEGGTTVDAPVNAIQDAGSYLVSWNAGGFAAGKYRFVLRAGGFMGEAAVTI